MNEPSLLPADDPSAGAGGMTIGAVCDLLRADFPSISISKIRYLEDQKLVSPQRTPGGYRLYSPLEVERLRTILRLQRDEFLPLRVIKQELESSTTGAFSVANQAKQLKRAHLAEPAPTRRYSVGEILSTTGASAALLKALEEYGLIGGDGGAGFDETDREVVQTALELSSYGVEPRHLRIFRVAAEREAGLLQQLLTVGLRSRNPERRREALDALETLAALASHMRHLMLISELRQIANP
ncbi:MerR family transcriptional regulator [Miltoncostaea oceani]|uniref:transcriptional regulator FtsR n=1 Tax=Miltoncostaea oceani TaxID=2843216 RepID=UPI001C3E3D64|nr:MerR family transcriptional regulator [Miltoncostaea oceani]